MADKETEQTQDEAAENTEKLGLVKRSIASCKKFAKKCATPKVLFGLAMLSFAVQGCLYWYYATRPGPESREVDLGKFQYVAYSPDGSLNDALLVEKADFELHVSLNKNSQKRATELMGLRKRKLRQGIEELIRQARDREFADPELVELKRRLMEQINHTLGIKAVDEVLITELRLSVRSLATANEPETETVETSVSDALAGN